MAEGGRRLYRHHFFKKASPNYKVTLYIKRRDLVLDPDRVERLEGVVLVDPEYAEDRTIYGHIIKRTRYAEIEAIDEEDREKAYSENIMQLVKIWPPCEENPMNVPSVQPLVRRLGPNATPFCMEVATTWPPSLILWPREPCAGPPIGMTYSIRVSLEEPDDIESKHNIVRMGFRVTHSASRIDTAPLLTPSPSVESFRVRPLYQRIKVRRRPRNPVEEDLPEPVSEDEFFYEDYDMENIKIEELDNREKLEDIGEEEEYSFKDTYAEVTVKAEPLAAFAPRPAPRLTIEKSFLFTNGQLHLESWLDRSNYHHGQPILITLHIANTSTKTVRCIEAEVIQFIDVFIFNKCHFKNVVAFAIDESNSVPPGSTRDLFYTLVPRQVPTKSWIAIEDSVNLPESSLASTIICPCNSEKYS